MKARKKIDVAYFLVPVSIVAVLGVIAAFTGMWPWKENAYNSYTLQACSWLEGRLDLGQDYPWLELAIYGGKYYVSFPPFPSFVMLPFAMIFGTNTPDHYIGLAVTMVGAVYGVKLYMSIQRTRTNVELYVLLLYVASGLLFVCANGYVWFIAQNMCFTLSLMSLYYAQEGKGGWSLAFWACAVGCRPMVVLYFPFLVYLLRKKWKQGKEQGSWWQMLREKWSWCIAVSAIAVSYMVLNYARFGSVTEFGHNYLPEFTRVSTGQFHISYLKANIKNLLRLPTMGGENQEGALQFVTSDGMAFWLITPFFLSIAVAWLYGIWKRRKEQLPSLLMLPVLALLHVIFICSHRTLGGWHFGNRYLMDLLPYLFTGFLFWKPKNETFDRCNIPILIFGFALNLVGTVATYNGWI